MKHHETPNEKRERLLRARGILKKLKQLLPGAGMMLTFNNEWELLVAVQLSAQCTDKKVNEITPALFAQYPKLEDYVRADPQEFEQMIFQSGFYRNKTKNILAAAKVVQEKFKGKLPKTMAEMLTIPGIGRKSANVILGNAYGVVEGIAVDTHIWRLSRKLGLTDHNTPEKIERDLMQIIDAASALYGRPLLMIAEIKHATYFESIGLPLDELFAREVRGWASEQNLVIESFEQSVLLKIRAHGIPGRLVFLAEREGAPADLVAADGRNARSYADHLTDAGLARLATEVEGVSVDKRLILVDPDFVARAHAAGLLVYTWTLRPENKFLSKPFRVGAAAAAWGNWRGEFARIIDTGLDGVFADHPDLAVTALASLKVGRRK